MNRARSTLAIAALAALLLPATASSANSDRIRSQIGTKGLIPVPVPVNPVPVFAREPERPLRVDVWVPGGTNRLFFPGESVVICFRANRDAFVLIYDIDTEGRAHRLYPRAPGDPEFVEGGVTYSVPGRGAGYWLMVTGPSGTETIVATAGDLPLADQWDACWGGVAGPGDYDRLGGSRYRVGRVAGDRQAGVDHLNQRLIGVPVDEYYGPEIAVDQVSFRVGQPGREGWYRDRGHDRDRDRYPGRGRTFALDPGRAIRRSSGSIGG